MPDRDSADGDALEQQQDPSDPATAVGDDRATERSIETPEADAVEQQTTVREATVDVGRREPAWDADEGDLAESAREVPFDDDDYR
jgi:hypothetical protein